MSHEIEIQVAVEAQNLLGEGPLWNWQEQRLYWTDIENNCIYRFDPQTGQRETFEAGCAVGCIGFCQSGSLVLATSRGFAFWNLHDPLVFVGDPEADKPESRFNDGAVDPQGRFWAGTYGPGYTSALYRLDPGGAIQRLVDGVACSNGIGWSLDHRTMYFTDSTPQKIYAFDFDPATGHIEHQRDFVDSTGQSGFPDGLAVDSEGFIWSARWGGWCLQRFDPAGKLERTVNLPVEFPTSCAFGGTALDQLYISSAYRPVAVENRASQPLAGHVLRLSSEVRGLPEPLFA